MRKATLGRRKLTGYPIKKIIGFTVMSRFIDKDVNGSKQTLNLVKFIEVNVRKYVNSSKLTVRKNAEAKRDQAWNAVLSASTKAHDIANSQGFPCIVIAKIQKTSLIIKKK